MSIPVRRGDGVAGGVGLVGGASPRGDRASALDRVKTLKTRLLIASVLQAASAILVQVALAACPRACRFTGSELRFLLLYRLPADTARKPCKLPARNPHLGWTHRLARRGASVRDRQTS